MTLVYVDEKIHGSLYSLGILVIHNETWRQQFIKGLLGFRPPLMFHATDDRQINQRRVRELKEFIDREIGLALPAGDILEWKLVSRNDEKSAWKSFVDWAYSKYRPSQSSPLMIYRDRATLRRDTDAMLAGNDRFRFQPKPKVQSAETRPDPHKVLIGVVDYILFFNLYGDL